MPNTAVRAAGEALPVVMLNRSAILKDAWNRYRICNRGRAFNRKDFAFSLGCAWDAAKRAMMTPIERQIDAIKAEIAGLDYAPARVNIVAKEQALKARLAALA